MSSLAGRTLLRRALRSKTSPLLAHGPTRRTLITLKKSVVCPLHQDPRASLNHFNQFLVRGDRHLDWRRARRCHFFYAHGRDGPSQT